jgi:hypothetical protein
MDTLNRVALSVVLCVVEGPDAGRQRVLPVGSFCVLGRVAGLDGSTFLMADGDRRRLEREDQSRATEHLERRRAPGLAGARDAVSAFEREADVDLADEAVSQTHAMVFLDEAGASVVDIASTNGTWVNGARVLESVLVVGDLLRVGETRIEIRSGSSAA